MTSDQVGSSDCSSKLQLQARICLGGEENVWYRHGNRIIYQVRGLGDEGLAGDDLDCSFDHVAPNDIENKSIYITLMHTLNSITAINRNDNNNQSICMYIILIYTLNSFTAIYRH